MRFLNSGGFIGYAKDIYELLNVKEISNTYDDQLFYSELFVDKKLREKHQMKLDTKAEFFQNLNGNVGKY